MNPIITKNISQIETLCKNYKVKELYAFGSVTRDDFKKSCDVDWLVDFKRMPILNYADNYFDLAFALKNIYKRKVDLRTIKSLQNPIFIKVIDRTKIPRYLNE